MCHCAFGFVVWIDERYRITKSLDTNQTETYLFCSTICSTTMAYSSSSSSSSSDNRSDELVVFKVDDFQTLARERLPVALYEYIASGTDDEQTLRENRSSFAQWYLRPRVMRPVANLSCRTSLFRQSMAMPLFVSPAGVHALCDENQGECATARACQDANILFGLSQHATRSIEDVAQAAAPGANLWYQAYILKDRAKTLQLVRRAVKAGYQGIFLTVDSVRFGFREADARNGFNALPHPHRLVNYDSYGDDDEESSNDNGTTSSRSGNSLDATYNARQHKAWDQNSEQMWEQNVTWEDVGWLKANTCPHLPLIVKGIMTGEDADQAMNAGADGVMVSNHGGRQLDGALAAIDVLPEVVAAVRQRGPVLLDGGVRRGTDVLKALALGATAVGIGKPVFFALAVGGESAVRQMLGLFRTEIEAAMAICGCETVGDITSSLVSRHPLHIRASL